MKTLQSGDGFCSSTADATAECFFFCVILIVEIGHSGAFKKKKKVAVLVPRKYRLPMWW